MPFQPINFASIPAQQNTFDLTDALMKGYQAGQMPAQTQRAINAQNIVNALKQAQAAKANIQVQNPYYGLPAGNAGQVEARERIKEKYGEDSPQLKLFDQKWNSQLLKDQNIINFRNELIKNMGKKNATTLGKEELEIDDIQSGFMPGTNRTVKLSPDEQFDMLNRYKLRRQKEISDNQTRQKVLNASNIDKTFDIINDPSKLFIYSGLNGQAMLKGDQVASAVGKPPQRFIEYQKALTAANTLAKQVRQFYGDSITPQIQEKLSALTNPTGLTIDPSVALSNFNQFKKILKNGYGNIQTIQILIMINHNFQSL